jgi:V8-like Glu-specific endopeptidase
MAGVHHPSGDVMKISFAYKSAQPDRWSGNGPSTHWRVSSWDLDTTTEPGSSGSPLFNQNGQIIGQLHGGAAAFPNNSYDTYGGIYYSWNDGLSQFLDPLGTGGLETVGANL